MFFLVAGVLSARGLNRARARGTPYRKWLANRLKRLFRPLLAVLAGNEYNVLQDINVFPRIPVDEGTLSTAGIIALVVALAASLVGAILGAIAGVRYHRKVDRAGMVV